MIRDESGLLIRRILRRRLRATANVDLSIRTARGIPLLYRHTPSYVLLSYIILFNESITTVSQFDPNKESIGLKIHEIFDCCLAFFICSRKDFHFVWAEQKVKNGDLLIEERIREFSHDSLSTLLRRSKSSRETLSSQNSHSYIVEIRS